MIKTILTILTIMGLFSSCNSNFRQQAKNTVQTISIDKYMGKWYEIYRLPMRAERDLVNVTATYSLNNDGTVKVINQGFKHTPNGKHKKATAKAWQPLKEYPGALKVRFFRLFTSPYFILALDKEYNWAIVSSGQNNYAWILSREPALPEEIEKSLLDSAHTFGIDTARFIKTKQQW